MIVLGWTPEGPSTRGRPKTIRRRTAELQCSSKEIVNKARELFLGFHSYRYDILAFQIETEIVEVAPLRQGLRFV